MAMTTREKAFVLNGLRTWLQSMATMCEDFLAPEQIDRELFRHAQKNGITAQMLEEVRIDGQVFLEAEGLSGNWAGKEFPTDAD